MQQELHDCQRVKSSSHIVKNNSHSPRQLFQLPHWWGLHDIEAPEEYKARQQRFPRDGGKQESDPLAGNFVDHYELRVFHARGFCRRCGRWNADGGRLS